MSGKDEYDDLLDELGLADSPVKERMIKSPAVAAKIPASPPQGLWLFALSDLKHATRPTEAAATCKSPTCWGKRPWFHMRDWDEDD